MNRQLDISEIRDVDHFSTHKHLRRVVELGVYAHRFGTQIGYAACCLIAAFGDKLIAIPDHDRRPFARQQPYPRLRNRFEHRTGVGLRTADHPQNVCAGSLAGQ